MNTLNADNSLVLIIDIQERLVGALDKDIVVSKAVKIASAAKVLRIPVMVTEQYPKGLGNTVPMLKEVLAADTLVVEKTSFNALLEDGMAEKIASYGKKQIVIFGIETHICVHQTAAALIEAGYDVYVIKDACASRNKYEFKQGIDIMQQNGAKISCVEIALFEWLKGARNPKFKEVQALIK
ncbi:TPA: isochorismatase family protein [Candidatus Scatousia excrementigallinarum]|uniref:Isochorismatase family protein n=1 Tax=Candidatus Scatousia excrementigallinarum TaxID=2840935 RepID=A0A9D1EXD6_9BACT|nr:isochorismatase family protein [Candidatus Scatousia excrementigallinarum]